MTKEIPQGLQKPTSHIVTDEGKEFSKKRTLIFFIGTAIFILLQYFIFTAFGDYTLDHIDFTSQHYRFPEYFRQLFYSTGELFPDYAANIGGGQNIYNFSYYGLYNPIILVSYLLPFVPMKLYIRVSAYLSVYIASILLYKWLSRRFSQRVCEYSAILFLLASPLLYHCHRHVMFITYMPFVLLALIGADRLFEKRRFMLLSISVCLICLTSYFFSIGAIIGITVYGIFRYLELRQKDDIRDFVKNGARFALAVVIGVAMAAFLLLPTFPALLSGRAEGGSIITLKQILLPTVSADSILYSAYSPGLCALSLLALIFCIFRKRGALRFLCTTLILPVFLPVILYMLNAAMYIDAKALIPLLPLYILVTAFTLDYLLKKEYPCKSELICLALVSVVSVLIDSEYLILLADVLILIISAILVKRYKRPVILVAVSLTVAFLSFAVTQLWDEKKPADTLPSDTQSKKIVEDITEADDGLFRISDRTMNLEIANRVLSEEHYISSVYSSLSNQNYAGFYYDLIGNEIIHRSRGQMTNTDNPLYDIYMGNRYVIGNRSDTNGYTHIGEYGDLTLYRNENALPIAFSSNRIMSAEQYQDLEFPYNTEALLKYTVCENAPYTEFESSIRQTEMPEYEIVSRDGLNITKTEKGYRISSESGGVLKLRLMEPIRNSLFFVRFDMVSQNSKSDGDSIILINGRCNKRAYRGWKYDSGNSSLEYVFNELEQREFEIEFSRGSYELENFGFYITAYDEFVSQLNAVDAMQFDKKVCGGDLLEGTLTARDDGYLHFSIPYDKGYTLYIDGKETEIEMTDNAFIGAKITKGEHHIRLEYQAPGASFGRIISLGAICTLLILSVYEEYRKRKS